MTMRDDLIAKCDELKEILLAKNLAYGNSALEPVRVFSTADNIEQLKVRLDDKLSRMQRGKSTDDVPEDTLMDLAGYLVLLMIAQSQNSVTETKPALAAGGYLKPFDWTSVGMKLERDVDSYSINNNLIDQSIPYLDN